MFGVDTAIIIAAAASAASTAYSASQSSGAVGQSQGASDAATAYSIGQQNAAAAKMDQLMTPYQQTGQNALGALSYLMGLGGGNQLQIASAPSMPRDAQSAAIMNLLANQYTNQYNQAAGGQGSYDGTANAVGMSKAQAGMANLVQQYPDYFNNLNGLATSVKDANDLGGGVVTPQQSTGPYSYQGGQAGSLVTPTQQQLMGMNLSANPNVIMGANQIFNPAISGAISGLGNLAGSVQGQLAPVQQGLGYTADQVNSLRSDLTGQLNPVMQGLGNLSTNLGQQGASVAGQQQGLVNQIGQQLPGITQGLGNVAGNLGSLAGQIPGQINPIAQQLNSLSTGLGTQEQGYQQQIGNLVNQLTTPMTGQQLLQQDPGYQFRLQQGLGAEQAANSAQGLGLSSANLNSLDQYAQNYASGEYQNAWNRQQQGALNAAGLIGQQGTLGLNTAATQGGLLNQQGNLLLSGDQTQGGLLGQQAGTLNQQGNMMLAGNQQQGNLLAQLLSGANTTAMNQGSLLGQQGNFALAGNQQQSNLLQQIAAILGQQGNFALAGDTTQGNLLTGAGNMAQNALTSGANIAMSAANSGFQNQSNYNQQLYNFLNSLVGTGMSAAKSMGGQAGTTADNLTNLALGQAGYTGQNAIAQAGIASSGVSNIMGTMTSPQVMNAANNLLTPATQNYNTSALLGSLTY